MKIRLLTLLLASLILPAITRADPAEDFAAAIRKAIIAHDEQALIAMSDHEGLDEGETTQLITSIRALFAHPKVFSVALGPLPQDFTSFYILNGHKFEPTRPPEGIVTVTYQLEDGLTSTQRAYATRDGEYRMVGVKNTLLPWAGPDDITLTYSVSGPGAEEAVVNVLFNASGAFLKRTLHSPTANLRGQFFEKIEVQSDNPKSELTLEVFQGTEQVHKSDPFKGTGTLVYQRPAPEKKDTEKTTIKAP